MLLSSRPKKFNRRDQSAGAHGDCEACDDCDGAIRRGRMSGDGDGGEDDNDVEDEDEDGGEGKDDEDDDD